MWSDWDEQATKDRHESWNKLTLGCDIMIGSMIALKMKEKEYLINLKSMGGTEVTAWVCGKDCASQHQHASSTASLDGSVPDTGPFSLSCRVKAPQIQLPGCCAEAQGTSLYTGHEMTDEQEELSIYGFSELKWLRLLLRCGWLGMFNSILFALGMSLAVCRGLNAHPALSI